MNGDILTNVDFEDMLNQHLIHSNEITIATVKNSYNIPYGVIELNDGRVSQILEKPCYDYIVSGGLYIINSNLIKEIPKNEYYDITSLFNKLLEENRRIGIYDIGWILDNLKIFIKHIWII